MAEQTPTGNISAGTAVAGCGVAGCMWIIGLMAMGLGFLLLLSH
jgi:hypothetical protein